MIDAKGQVVHGDTSKTESFRSDSYQEVVVVLECSNPKLIKAPMYLNKNVIAASKTLAFFSGAVPTKSDGEGNEVNEQ